jgi:NADH-quinone oxidoreductase subunit M
MNWLLTLLLVPAVGAVVVALLPKERPELAKQVALGFSVATLVLVVAMALQFDATSTEPFQFVTSTPWIESFGISFALGVDGIALVLIALAAILVPVVILAGWNEADHSDAPTKGYFALMLALLVCMIGVFSAIDVFLFYVFFEVMLIPMYFMIGRYGGARRSYAAVKFLIVSLFGGLFMLASLIGLYVVSQREFGAGTFDFGALTQLGMDSTTQRMLFLGFFFAFAVKAPLWPFHTWLPDAATEAQPGSAVLLVGVLDKVGTFGMLRYCLQIFPEASQFYTPLIIVLSVVGIVYGALLAIGQTDIKRLIAYTSVSHFGFITLGIFVLTSQGQSGSTLYMINHGFSTAALFLVAGFLISRRGSKLVEDYGGVHKVAPLLAGFFLIAGLSSLALPGMSSFVSEFLVLVGTYVRYPLVAVIATSGIILAALYILWLYQRTMTGPVKPGCGDIKDLGGREIVAVSPLVALIIALGVFPAPALNVINPAVTQTLSVMGVQDPSVGVTADCDFADGCVEEGADQ